MLEDKELIGVKTKIVLVELVSVLGHDAVIRLLGENVPVHVHIAMILLEYLWHEDDSLACLAVEALVQLLGAFGSKDLLSEVLENLTGMCIDQITYKRNLPAFHFLGKLLQKIPVVVKLIFQIHGTFLDYVCSGLSESDEAVQSALIYVLNHFYQPGCIQGVSPYVHKAVVENLPKMIITTNQQDLQMNIIGLLKLVLNVPHLTQQLMLSNGDDTTLAAGLKKLLICHRDILQIATVQCISQVLTQDQGCAYADDFLHVDVAEFLFESLATTNEVLLGSILCCLLQFTDSEIFFKNHHSVYGLESILRGTEQALRLRNPQTVTPAMKLLAILLDKHPPGISLFSNAAMLAQAIQLITDGIKFSQPTVAQQAIRALQHVIKHCPKGGAPQPNLLLPLQYLKQQAVTMLNDVTNEKKRKGVVKRRDRNGGQRIQVKLEETLDQMVMVLVSVSKYVCECLEEPRLDLISSAPVSLGSDASAEALTTAGLAEFLVLASDEVCLPLTMIYCEETPKVPVLQSVYRFLCLQYHFKLPVMHSISKKYAETEFICFTLETKGKFRDKNLQEDIEDFMMHVCSDLFSAHHGYTDTMAYKTQLTQGLPHLQGCTEDLLSLLSETDDNESSWVQSAQIIYISIMFFEAYYTNSCRLSSVPASGYCESLSNFILSRHNLSSVPDYSWWQIMFLWAMLTKGVIGQQNTSSHHQLKALSVLEDVANDRTVSESLITMSVSLLTWTFSNSDLAELVGTRMLKLWLSSTGREDKENYNQLVALVMENQLCLQSLLGLVSLGEEDVTEAAVKLLKATLEKGLEGNPDTTTFSALEENITSTTLQMCLARKDWDVPSHNLVAMFQILALIKKQHCDSVNPTSGDMKLLYHACCIIKKDTTSVGLCAAVLGYLCCVLVQSKLHNDIQGMLAYPGRHRIT
ncbi:meiosis inhibitor protein 1-like [Lineus longissimus]|uniref:meiosis inhibitor protein 1-like n=1 Tax=Lineus longissimus TaxID=88925 RepID=UPI00315D2A27